MSLTPSEMCELKKAKGLLENPGIAAKVSNFVGTPIEIGNRASCLHNDHASFYCRYCPQRRRRFEFSGHKIAMRSSPGAWW